MVVNVDLTPLGTHETLAAQGDSRDPGNASPIPDCPWLRPIVSDIPPPAGTRWDSRHHPCNVRDGRHAWQGERCIHCGMMRLAAAADCPWLPPPVADIPPPNTGYTHHPCDRCEGRRHDRSGICPRCHGMGYVRRLVEYPMAAAGSRDRDWE